MTDHMSLDDGFDTVTFSPKPYTEPGNRPRSQFYAQDGTLYVYEWGSKVKFILHVELVDRTDRDLLYGWWQSLTSLTFKPYLTVSGDNTSHTVKITNMESPIDIQSWGISTTYPAYHYCDLTLEEVAS